MNGNLTPRDTLLQASAFVRTAEQRLREFAQMQQASVQIPWWAAVQAITYLIGAQALISINSATGQRLERVKNQLAALSRGAEGEGQSIRLTPAAFTQLLDEIVVSRTTLTQLAAGAQG